MEPTILNSEQQAWYWSDFATRAKVGDLIWVLMDSRFLNLLVGVVREHDARGAFMLELLPVSPQQVPDHRYTGRIMDIGRWSYWRSA